MYNKCIFIGRLTRKPEVKKTATGVSFCSFRIAVDRDRPASKVGERAVDFIQCIAWRARAEFIERNFDKGEKILVEGSLHINEIDSTGEDDKKEIRPELAVKDVRFVEYKKKKAESAPDAPVEPTLPPESESFEQIDFDEDLPF